MRAAMQQKYANIDWLTGERGLTLAALFDPAAARVKVAGSDEAARAVFDRLIRRIGDGHVDIDWPQPTHVGEQDHAPADACTTIGFDARRRSPGIAPHLAGYRPIAGSSSFPAGMVTVDGKPVGVIRIGGFETQGAPALCRAAIAALHIPVEKPCDGSCQDSILTWTYDRMTQDLADRAAQFRVADATALVVDISDNGGGSEWAEAAARMLAAKPISSERIGFVRGQHWAKHWDILATQLRAAAAKASPVDQAKLVTWAKQAEAARAQAEAGNHIGGAGFATGLVGEAKSGSLPHDGWGPAVFSPAQFSYRDGAWRGPLVVIVDDETWSAAEEFAAVLQDNRVAVLIGSRSGGAGCGHTDGGTPTILAHSGATLELPDCIRFRADGSNEVRGVIPDLLVGLRDSDGDDFKAGLIDAVLPEAVRRAQKQ